MAVTRVGTAAQQQLVINAALRAQGRVLDTQAQLATGKKTQVYSGIANDTNRLITVKSDLAKAEQFIENTKNVEKRLDLMSFAVETIDSTARSFRTSLTNAINGDGANVIDLPAQAGAFVDQIVELLNTRDDSRYLFAGGKINAKPVDLGNGVYTPPAPPPFDAVADTGYYEGDAVQQSVRIDQGYELPYGINADASAFEKVLRAMDNIAQMTFSNPVTAAEQQTIRDAITTLTEAIDDNGTEPTLSGLLNNVSLNIKIVTEQREKHENFINLAEDTVADIENVNTAETVARINYEQVQLEASYNAIARVSNLSLNNFL
ncbi:MAG: hypothetical protein AB7G39_13470 [Alphaproteobacteria bacterium]